MKKRILLQKVFIALIFFAISIFNNSCRSDINKTVTNTFKQIPSSTTGITFRNTIEEDYRNFVENFNYVYNGGGVAIGDINNDNIPDIYFTGNDVSDKLYLNLGDFKFKDISKKALPETEKGWSNGVVMVDVNSDGLLDIYVCRGGHPNTPEVNRKNHLFINQGDLSFKEMGKEFGLDDSGYSMQASFFDLDNDNDLDVYIVNRPSTFYISVAEILEGRKNGKTSEKDQLYINNNGVYENISESSGIGDNYGFGLGLVTSDINNDGYVDIFVANDFVENDYLFINNGDNTFTDQIKSSTNHNSFYSMGADIADIDNDGLEDIMVNEMLPSDYVRSKTNMAPMNRKGFNEIINNGIHQQYMHNVLHYNQGNGFFSDISQIAQVSKTDWSWSCLLSDFDNDGFKDIFVSNGYKRDLYNRDGYYKKGEIYKKHIGSFPSREALEKHFAKELVSSYPSERISNVIFKNNQNLTFSNTTEQWNLADLSFSNGAACGDLDNDGDLDLVISNVDDEPFIYQNNINSEPNYLKIKLLGPKGNLNGLGAKITLKVNDQIQYQEFKTVRGYLSSVEPIIHFGLGENPKIEHLTVQWPDGKKNILKGITPNNLVEVAYKKASVSTEVKKGSEKQIFTEVTDLWFDQPFNHQENLYDDYAKQVLLPQKYSTNGPFVAVADINNDGLEDFYIGGASGQSGQIYVQLHNQKFKPIEQKEFIKDRFYEDLGCSFFDADNDGDMDLYVVSGGYEFEPNSKNYQDRLYLNDGDGNFKKSLGLPKIDSSGGCVTAADFDNDGDLDLFVGGRVVPEYYPFSPWSILLQNDGDGNFKDITDSKAPDLKKIGMITSAVWNDIDSDNDLDLIVVGEWMPITLFINNNGFLEKSKESKGLEHTSGWWNKIIAQDIDNDGDTDFIVGNLGENHKFKASIDKPLHVYANDYDMNGKFDVFLAKYYKDKQVPVRGFECSTEQIPSLRKKFKSYENFANANINEILGKGIDYGLHLKAETFSSVFLINNGGVFEKVVLPTKSQFSSIHGFILDDFTRNGQTDILLAGNQFNNEIETSRADASCGLLLKGLNGGKYKVLSPEDSGFFVPYNVKDLKTINLGKDGNGLGVLGASNNDTLRLYKLNAL